MRIIMLGPPGSGKGTYSKRMSPELGIPHISTGDIFREHLKKETEIGKKIKEVMRSGGLVPDDIVMEIVKDRLSKEDAQKGFIFDGFPRTLFQAKELEKTVKVDVVVNLYLPDDVLIEKLSARRICKECGDIYNIADINREGIRMPAMNPKVQGKCDKCGGELIQRKDDTEEVIRERLEVYKKQTEPLIKFYRDKELILDIKVTDPPGIMVPRILGEIKKFRGEKYG
ncbi:MAG: adenylate kinase [Candidatus Aenigmatarchaeota archaeon]